MEPPKTQLTVNLDTGKRRRNIRRKRKEGGEERMSAGWGGGGKVGGSRQGWGGGESHAHRRPKLAPWPSNPLRAERNRVRESPAALSFDPMSLRHQAPAGPRGAPR